VSNKYVCRLSRYNWLENIYSRPCLDDFTDEEMVVRSDALLDCGYLDPMPDLPQPELRCRVTSDRWRNVDSGRRGTDPERSSRAFARLRLRRTQIREE
jgi:hypothetical protein